MPLEAEVRQVEAPPAYQRIAPRAVVLQRLGLSLRAAGRIARRLTAQEAMLVRRAGRSVSVRVPRPPSQPGVLVITCRPTPGSAVAEIAMSTGGELRYPRTAARINSDTARPLRAASRRSSPSSSAGNRVENTVIPLGVGTTTCSSFSISLSIALPFLLRARPPGYWPPPRWVTSGCHHQGQKGASAAPSDESIRSSQASFVPHYCNTGCEHSIAILRLDAPSPQVAQVVIIPLEFRDPHNQTAGDRLRT